MYKYDTTSVSIDEASGRIRAVPTEESLKFVTQRVVPRVGVMFVGWGGNNGTTVTGGILANKHGVTWRTKSGVRSADYVGSMTQSSTVRVCASVCVCCFRWPPPPPNQTRSPVAAQPPHPPPIRPPGSALGSSTHAPSVSLPPFPSWLD
jgi:hypothetical protein